MVITDATRPERRELHLGSAAEHARAVQQVLAVDGPFGRFAERVLVAELPDLTDDRRVRTVAFVCRRAAQTAGPPRLGVILLAALVGASERAVDPDRSTAWLRDTTLPFVGELARLVRSLAYAFVWETWPDTLPTGAPGTAP